MAKFSKKLNVQLIAEVFKAYGIRNIILSPGSRNGSLATHFSHHPDFKTYSIVDERSAGFVALGMAQRLQEPVAVCSTSGSAVVNYYPAVTEAFYKNIPLIVLSADRPEHLTDNFDGQTIRQKNVLDMHTYHSTQLTEDESTEALTDNLGLMKKAVNSCISNSGPVHINMPFSEPLYEFKETTDIQFDQFTLPDFSKNNEEIDIKNFAERWNQSSKKLVLVGLHYPNKEFNDLMNKLAKDDSAVVLTETTSNIHSDRFFNKIDSVIFSLTEEELENLKPEILLTVGQNVISKKVKAFVRNHKPEQHWHLDKYWQPDTFQCLTDKIEMNAISFLKEFATQITPADSDYFKSWDKIRREKEILQNQFSKNVEFSDFKVFEKLIETFPEEAEIHYSNSSVIRYAQLFNHNSSNEIFCNRGTSGIDGCTSTAAGAAIASQKQVILVTGDISFFYDSNGLWNPYLPDNFRIILINNGGGNIFRIIPGPENSGVMETVFETKHHLSAEHLAKMFEFDYLKVNDNESLNKALTNFYSKSNQPKILEINTSEVNNSEIQREYFKI